MTTPALHPAIEPYANLLGTWSGTGAGDYPTIDPFAYVETVTFEHVGKPFLLYQQRTRRLHPDGSLGEPLHAESGYWRFPTAHRVEMVVSHPTGISEIEEGHVAIDSAMTIELASTAIGMSGTAKQVTRLERTFRVEDDALSYTVRMAAVGLPLQHHLAAALTRSVG